MTYEEFLNARSLCKLELLAHANGTLLEDAPAGLGMLPAPPLLMFDRVTSVERDGSRGRIVAEQDVALDAWYFWCHFRRDPVQPGCLGVDAVWQLIGLYLLLRGAAGAGRALGCGDVDFFGQIRPHNKLVRYDVEIRRYTFMAQTGTALAVGDAEISVDGEPVYRIKSARAGTFAGILYGDYPHPSANSLGRANR